MDLPLLAKAITLAYASGISAYATVALAGLAIRAGWVGAPPGALMLLASTWVITVALVLYAVEFVATLIPGVASAWETLHSLIRPPAAAALAAATAWSADPVIVVLATVLGGGMAVATHTTKLGFRYAIDTSPEPVTNGIANVGELAVIGAIIAFVWQHPVISLAVAILLLVVLALTVRLIWRALRAVFSGRWMPACGLLQEARTSDTWKAVEDERR
ncbi:MAG: DUF4126 domain-containing protein [Gemmatimonadaceae bacterium]|nr:DUF4126 domain-containing protein [Gemmatimonadaceae bacterium]